MRYVDHVKIRLTDIDNTLAICCTVGIHNHDGLFYIAHDQVHMAVVRLNESQSIRFWNKVA